MKKHLLLLVAAISPLLLTGCGVIFSQQNYGATNYQEIVQGASKTEVLANLGIPNAIYRSEVDNRETFIYSYTKGKNILGVFSKIERRDTVVIFDPTEVVVYVGEVTVGKGNTILSGPFTDATHPVRTETLLFEPANYSYNTESESAE